jgi:hypothetical protein
MMASIPSQINPVISAYEYQEVQVSNQVARAVDNVYETVSE